MPRKFTASKKQLKPDPKFHSKLVSKFINSLMLDGKKSVSQRIVYDAIGMMEKRIKDVPPLEAFETALQNVQPMIEVRSRRVGGSTYQVPTQVKPSRQQALAFRWILQASRGKKGKPMSQRLGDELCAAYKREGAAMTTRDNVHRMAEANKAFSHFAW
jgi:small subunit ribosomal protein S7